MPVPRHLCMRPSPWLPVLGLLACTTISPATDTGTDSDVTTTTGTGGTSGVTGSTGAPSPDPDSTATTGDPPDPTTGAEPFEHELHTLVTDEGRLALHSNLPPRVDDCLALPAALPPCEDLDADGLVDAWEDAVLDRLRPLRRFDEEEAAVDDAEVVLADVGRVAPAPDGAYRLMVMLGYSRDYGSCGFTAHNGDSERVALDLVPLPEEGAGGVVVRRAYTAAHEGTANDHGRVFADGELDQLVLSPDPRTNQPRWTVFPSADKHATYATIEICEGISPLPCLDEDCGPDGVADPAAYDRLPPVGNAGELVAPRLTDLSELGFAGEDAWADQDFCGGLGGTECSSSVRSKLLDDPFP